MEDKKTSKVGAHTVSLGSKICITGVVNVLVLTDRYVEVALEGNVLVLNGSGFSPLHLAVDEGCLQLAGRVSSLKYAHSTGKESFWRRLVK